MENIVRQDTLGKIEQMSVKYDLLKRGTYTMTVAPGKFHAVKVDKTIPLQLTGSSERAADRAGRKCRQVRQGHL